MPLPRRCAAFRLLLALGLAGVTTLAMAGTSVAASADVGARIYLEGVLPDGSSLQGRRADGQSVQGRLAACVNCHHRSGLGGAEGDVAVPPITGRALFGTGEPVVVRYDLRFNAKLSAPHPPYDMPTFAAIVREGQLPGERTVHPVMPRYVLDDVALQALAAYLVTLSAGPSPGVGPREIQLATVVTPGVASARQEAWLATLRAAVEQHNLNVASGLRQRVPATERRLHTRRRWNLAVWNLEGDASTWAGQLARYQQQAPAFALVSGLAADTWWPVQEFCEKRQVACWFPSLDAPPSQSHPLGMSLYFSRGIALEGEVLAQRLMANGSPPGRVLVLRDAGAAAGVGAKALAGSLADGARTVQELTWGVDAPDVVAQALSRLQRDDAVVAWLRPAALAELRELPVPAARMFVSTAFAPEAAGQLAPRWLAAATLVDRYEQPPMRAANLHQYHAWRMAQGLPDVDERLQAEAYFAVNFLAATLSDMLNNLHTGYLIERAQQTLSLRETERAQMEVQAMMMGGGARQPVAAAAGHGGRAIPPDIERLMARQGTTPYPRLGLGIGQHFASKGAYLVPPPGAISPSAEWIVP